MKRQPNYRQFLNQLSHQTKRFPGLQSANPIIRMLTAVAVFILLALMSFVGLVLFLLVFTAGILLSGIFYIWRRWFHKGDPVILQSVSDHRSASAESVSDSARAGIIEAEYEIINRDRKK